MRHCSRRAGPRLVLKPDWHFAEEYYGQRRWLACRRGALWEEVVERNIVIPCRSPCRWHDKHDRQCDLGQRQQPLPLCLRLVRAQRVRLPRPGAQARHGVLRCRCQRRLLHAFCSPPARPLPDVCSPSSRARANVSISSATSKRNRPDQYHRCPDSRSAWLLAPPSLRLAKGTHSGHNTLGNFAHDGVQMAIASRNVKIDALDAVAIRLGSGAGRFHQDRRGRGRSQRHRRCQATCSARCRRCCSSRSTRWPSRRSSEAPSVCSGTLRHEFDYEILIFSPELGLLEARVNNQPCSANIVARPREPGSRLVGHPEQPMSAVGARDLEQAAAQLGCRRRLAVLGDGRVRRLQ